MTRRAAVAALACQSQHCGKWSSLPPATRGWRLAPIRPSASSQLNAAKTIGTNLRLTRLPYGTSEGKMMSAMKTFAALALSAASILTTLGSANAYPISPVGSAGIGTDIVQVDDRGHNWKHQNFDEHTSHHNDDRWRYHDRHYDNRHHGQIGAILGGALPPHRRHYDD
jgi:hypothetical protein